MNVKLSILAVIIGALCIILPNRTSKFYGFEYEDAFVNTSVASSENFLLVTKNFRTNPFICRINGEFSSQEYYSGHYIAYAAYLASIKSLLNIEDNHRIHIFGNFLLLLSSLLIVYRFTNSSTLLFIFAIVCTLPFQYVFVSSLIENASFTLSIILVGLISYSGKLKRKDLWCWLLVFLLLMVKRENLVLLVLPILFFNIFFRTSDLKLFVLVGLIVLSQIVINPFHTEFIESAGLQANTFSIDYLKFQLPVYLKSLFSLGGMIIPMSILLLSVSRVKLKNLAPFVLFILIYSIHYRSRFAISSHEIDLFDTYRYIVNSSPWLLLIFHSNKNVWWRGKWFVYVFVFILSLASLIRGMEIKEGMYSDEYITYHAPVEIFESEFVSGTIVDVYPLISLLNNENNRIDILDLNTFISVKDSLQLKKPIVLINRNGSYDVKVLESKYGIKFKTTEMSNCYFVYP